MGKVHTGNGWLIRIQGNEHPPVHVHVLHPDGKALIDIEGNVTNDGVPAKVIKQAVEEPHVTVIIAKRPCALIPPGIGKKEDVVKLDRDKCTRCQACIKIMCPALLAGPDGYPQIDPNICNACHLCTRVCNFGALKGGNEA